MEHGKPKASALFLSKQWKLHLPVRWVEVGNKQGKIYIMPSAEWELDDDGYGKAFSWNPNLTQH